ncbi:hypothetical protein [Alcanivorax sp. 1008]|uniref:hypothetical protein n=1 Tax=Alcanivorax sp. 1008 TaxID=2816853 RepID=UPI001D278CEE|nr:hypothetical protein [Alcanivorax sp. 1008]MCC1498157.1 hypothetical protein [Alcanivorax sp. 1008]
MKIKFVITVVVSILVASSIAIVIATARYGISRPVPPINGGDVGAPRALIISPAEKAYQISDGRQDPQIISEAVESTYGVHDVSTSTYRDHRILETLSSDEIFKIYDLDRLEVEGGKVKLNHSTRIVIENIFQTVSMEDLGRGKEHLANAILSNHGQEVASSFMELINQYEQFFESINEIDEQRNAEGIYPENVEPLHVTRSALQNRIFGHDSAEKLFKVERKAMTVFIDHEEQMKTKTTEPTEYELARMQEEYNEILRSEAE